MQTGVRNENAPSEREPAAFTLFGVVCTQHGIKKGLPLDVLDEVKTPFPAWP